jgi:hypothetical protein
VLSGTDAGFTPMAVVPAPSPVPPAPPEGRGRRYSWRVSTIDPSSDIETTSETVERLRRENERLRYAEPPIRTATGDRWRRIFSWVLVVVTCLLAVLSVVAVFGRNQLLNTDDYVATVAPLASNPAIQEAVATQVSAQLIAHTNVEERVKKALPHRAAFLATPIAAELQTVTGTITLKLVESRAFQLLWVSANRAVHRQLVSLLTGSSAGALSTNKGTISIDLAQVESHVKQELDAKGITIFNKVPLTRKDSFVLFHSDQLARFQRLTRLLNHLVVVLPILALLSFAGAIVLTSNRRKGLVRASVGLALSMVVILVVVAAARDQYLSLGPSRSRAANAAVIDTVTVALRDMARTVLIVAAVIAVVAVIAGNRQLRAWLRRRDKPAWMTRGPVHRVVVTHRVGLQWSVVVVGLVILVIWSNPTALVAVVVVLIALAVAGALGLLAAVGPRPNAGVAGSGSGFGPGNPIRPDEVIQRPPDR